MLGMVENLLDVLQGALNMLDGLVELPVDCAEVGLLRSYKVCTEASRPLLNEHTKGPVQS